MLTLEQAWAVSIRIAILGAGFGCLACYGIYQSVPGTLGGVGMGGMIGVLTLSYMSMAIAAKQGGQTEQKTEQETETHDIPNLGTTYANETRGFVRPDQTLLEVAPGQALVVSATRPQVEAVAQFIQLGKFNITYELTGKEKAFKRNQRFNAFRRELVERGLAHSLGGQVVQLNERGRYAFLHPLTR